ncbi:MAG: MFS transporter [Rhodospirillales bacterium]|nr:MFS transporter [Rhodospirillales bacterium]
MPEISNKVSRSSPDPSRKNVVMLALSLALAMSGASMIMTVSALAGHMLAVDKSLATVPLALQMAFVMASTVPASMLMRRIGRRAGFIIGQGIGLAAGVICVAAIHQGSFAGFAVGSALFGSHNAFWQYYRFAAAETADAAFRSRAISLVMSGGVVAAICGPELAKFSRDLLTPFTFAGSYAIIGMLCVATVALLAFIDIPRPEARHLKQSGRPLAEIGRQPLFVVAVLSAMIGYGVMALVMTATPIAMMMSGHEFEDSAFVIQWHALGMFAPSFFTGHLIKRFGVLNIILVGALLNLACAGVNLSGFEVLQFWGGLVLLGVGWNFMFIGGTALLTETYRPAEQAKVQAFNDFLVFGLVTVGSFLSGAMLHAFGWDAVNYAVIAPVLVTFAATLWLRFAHRPDVAGD